MANKNSKVGVGDRAEQAYARLMFSEGWEVKEKATRRMIRINGRYVQKRVDLFGCFDLILVKNDQIQLSQVTDRHNLAEHKKRIETKFPVIFTIPNVRITIPLWHKVQHGKVERYEFDIVEWVFSEDLGRMIWVERQERLK